ncbi:MAG: GtrA family protein [Micavibrio aeruginosavorus]|uniref:GtrA family protein n=1 Tax=Micavibrio aeruginosavorus TaxID=349221 RepID=A0A2W5HQ28_9BACT|nr:MAG: GtrA family protein [Micavibrio aeruginosavorus]
MKNLYTIYKERYAGHVWELVRFGIVGVGATLTHLLAAFLLRHQTEIPLIAINIIAFLIAFGVSFIGHHYWTFQGASKKSESLPKFFGVALSGLAASTLLLSLLIRLDIANDFVKLFISIIIIPFVTYFLSKFWAFRTKQGSAS